MYWNRVLCEIMCICKCGMISAAHAGRRFTAFLLYVQGFDENMRTVLKQQYPADLFPQLMDTCRGVLVDLANAWPNQTQVPKRNLAMFLNVWWGWVKEWVKE